MHVQAHEWTSGLTDIPQEHSVVLTSAGQSEIIEGRPGEGHYREAVGSEDVRG